MKYKLTDKQKLWLVKHLPAFPSDKMRQWTKEQFEDFLDMLWEQRDKMGYKETEKD